MVAQFEVLSERLVLNQYSEPLNVADIDRMSKETTTYAEHQAQPIYVIADFSKIQRFPSSLLTLGLRPNPDNPVRNPKIESIVVVADSAFLSMLTEVVTKVIHVKKFVVVRTKEDALKEVEKLIQTRDAKS